MALVLLHWAIPRVPPAGADRVRCLRRACGGEGGRGGGRFGGAPDTATAVDRSFPGLCRATFRGGYTLSIMVADIGKGAVDHVTESTVEAREIWHNQPNDPVFNNINRMFWGDGHLVFPLSPGTDEWDRYWSVKLDGSTTKPDPAHDDRRL